MPGTGRARRAACAAAAVVLALTLGSCRDTAESTVDASSAGTPGNGGVVRVNGTRPTVPLYPGVVQDEGGTRLMDLLFRGLVRYDEDGHVVREVARSITTDDATTWRITLEKGWKFTNGEPVTSSSFVDAWNYAALGVNEQPNASFFSPIEGYADVHPSPPGARPSAKTMSGLEVRSDTVFTVTLCHPDPTFPRRLGAVAFLPLPTVAYKDKESFGEHPVGNGPYQLGRESQPRNGMLLQANPSFKGADVPHNGGIRITWFDRASDAYRALREGRLDVVDTVPADRLGSFAEQLGSRSVNRPAGRLVSLSFPLDEPPWQGERGRQLRRALSMAIDRERITGEVLHGTATPATDFSAPVVPGWSEQLCGPTCQFRPETARRLLRRAGGLDRTLRIAYPADGGHGVWVEAVCRDIHEVLDVSCEGRPFRDGTAYRTAISSGRIGTPYRSEWRMDYPGIADFLVPRFSSGGGANPSPGAAGAPGGYRSARFDAAVERAQRARDEDAMTEAYHDAERVLVHDLPVIPLWNPHATGGWSPRVTDVAFGVDGFPVYPRITRTDGRTGASSAQ
ncbi:MAG TPA: ABC transporter substrate-binding protein [Segeticoccus sp.]|jgi:oligopeptide transport system substrate-binding protein|nr:ABC transporter substrate-binding protein [Segeticoccus sp.]